MARQCHPKSSGGYAIANQTATTFIHTAMQNSMNERSGSSEVAAMKPVCMQASIYQDVIFVQSLVDYFTCPLGMLDRRAERAGHTAETWLFCCHSVGRTLKCADPDQRQLRTSPWWELRSTMAIKQQADHMYSLVLESPRDRKRNADDAGGNNTPNNMCLPARGRTDHQSSIDDQCDRSAEMTN